MQTTSEMLENLSIMQHHDAITGTHVKKVGRDYHRMMEEATNTAEVEMNEAISQHAAESGFNLSNVTRCNLIDGTIDCADDEFTN